MPSSLWRSTRSTLTSNQRGMAQRRITAAWRSFTPRSIWSIVRATSSSPLLLLPAWASRLANAPIVAEISSIPTLLT